MDLAAAQKALMGSNRNQTLVELQRRFPSFHERIDFAIAKATHTKSKKKKKETNDGKLNDTHHDRLIPAPEVKRVMVIGTKEQPQTFSDGHTESHLKFIQVDPNFVDDIEKKKMEEELSQIYDPAKNWRQAVAKAFESGAAKSMDVAIPKPTVFQRKRRNAILKTRGPKDFNPRLAWAIAIYRVIKVIQSVKESATIDTVRADKSLVSQLKEFQSKADSMTSAKIQQILSINSHMRPDKDIHFLNKVLFTRVRSFAKYSPEQRVQFCRVMRYEQHPKGATILKQGHVPYYYYFLFSGQCEVLKNRTDGLEGQVRVHILNAGDSFGAVALEGFLSERRSATVVCTVPSIFLLVDKDEYRRIASGQDSQDQIAFRISLLKNIHIFQDCEKALLEQMATKTRVKYFEQNSIIIVCCKIRLTLQKKEDEPCSRIHFIASGSVRLIKTITVIHQTPNSKKKQYVCYNPHIPLAHGQSLIQQQAAYITRHRGEFFPDLDNPDMYHEEDINRKQKLITRLTYNEPRGLNRAYVTVECKAPVVIIDMSKLDFAKMASLSMVSTAIDESKMIKLPMIELQKQWILQNEWEAYKKRVMEETNYKRDSDRKLVNAGLMEYSASWISKSS